MRSADDGSDRFTAVAVLPRPFCRAAGYVFLDSDADSTAMGVEQNRAYTTVLDTLVYGQTTHAYTYELGGQQAQSLHGSRNTSGR